MCGPSGQMENAAAQQSSLASSLQADFQSRFAGQGAVINNLNSLWTPIAMAGPNQQGFGAPELADLRTQAHEGVAANYGKATRALNNTLAFNGGGNEALPTGARAALHGRLASAAADQMSNADLGITAANYDQGRRNFAAGMSGLTNTAQLYDPRGYAGEATSAGNLAFNEDQSIQQMKNQKQQAIASGIAGLAMSAATFGIGGAGAGGGVGGFFKGGLKALQGGVPQLQPQFGGN